MLGNPLLDAIEQGRLRNEQERLAQQQRLMGLTKAPVVQSVATPQGDVGGMESMMPNVMQSPQQAYNSAVNWSNPSALGSVAKAVMPGAPMLSIAADIGRKNAIGTPGVRQLSAQPYGYYGQARGWSDKPSDNTPWAAQRAKFMPSVVNPEKRAAEESNQGMTGWGGTQQGMTAANFGVDVGDAAFEATFGGTYDDGGGLDDGGSWGGAGPSAIGGDFGMDSDTSVA